MAVDSKHPLYTEFKEDWDVTTDVYRGERVVKGKGKEYLAPTSGMVADGLSEGQPGSDAYKCYIQRAKFPDIFRQSISAMVGVMHHKPPVITLPPQLEAMRENATVQGESLDVLLRRINTQQLINGRYGILLDVPDGAPVGTLPYVATYRVHRIINWDDGSVGMPVRQNLNLVVLEETEFERTTDFEWEVESKWRVLFLGNPEVNEPEGGGVYQMSLVDDNSSLITPTNTIVPSIGGRVLDEIPFEFVNANDVVADPEEPPLLGLARLSLTIYRGEADYRQALFMQGQDTLVVIGDSNTEAVYRTGANASITLSDPNADAKYIGVDSEGLSEMREALTNDRLEAGQSSGQLIETASREKESGEALRVRVAARTASLNQVALTGAFGLQSLLKTAAKWVGADPDLVSVVPNLDFSSAPITGKTLVEYMTAKQMGAPISLRTIHDDMRRRDLTDRTFEEEVDEIETEAELIPRRVATGDENDDADEIDEEIV